MSVTEAASEAPPEEHRARTTRYEPNGTSDWTVGGYISTWKLDIIFEYDHEWIDDINKFIDYAIIVIDQVRVGPFTVLPAEGCTTVDNTTPGIMKVDTLPEPTMPMLPFVANYSSTPAVQTNEVIACPHCNCQIAVKSEYAMMRRFGGVQVQPTGQP